MHAAAARGNLPHHQLIYPPSLRYLPVWTLGALAHSDNSMARSSRAQLLQSDCFYLRPCIAEEEEWSN